MKRILAGCVLSPQRRKEEIIQVNEGEFGIPCDSNRPANRDCVYEESLKQDIEINPGGKERNPVTS